MSAQSILDFFLNPFDVQPLTIEHSIMYSYKKCNFRAVNSIGNQIELYHYVWYILEYPVFCVFF